MSACRNSATVASSSGLEFFTLGIIASNTRGVVTNRISITVRHHGASTVSVSGMMPMTFSMKWPGVATRSWADCDGPLENTTTP